MRLRTVLAFLLASILLLCCGCAPVDSGDADREAMADLRDDRQIYLTVWSWQIPTAEDARAYGEKAKECGFTAVDLAVLWADFEPLRGHFDWAYLDSVAAAFAECGLKLSLQPLLWTKDLEWAEDLTLQESESRKVYSVDGRGSFVSFVEPKTRRIVENTLQNFALHASRTYGKYLTRWGVRFSCFGEFDFSVNEELDYSGVFIRSFYDYLKDTYGSWKKLSDARGLGISKREELDALAYGDVVEACRGDWRRFRQTVLLDMVDSVCDIFRSADDSIPVVFSLGTYGNGMNSAYSGVADLWTALNECDADILALSLCDGADAGMMLSLATSLTTKKLSVEVDGAWALAEGRDVKSSVALAGTYEAFSLATANFTLEQLETHKATLSEYPSLFFAESTLGQCDPAKGILILSNALAEADPPRSYDAVYGELWRTLSENGLRRVRFVTEGQIASGDVSLEGVTALYPGDIKGSTPVSRAFADALSGTSVQVVGNLSFHSADGTEFPEDLKNSLAQRITKE